MKVAMLHRKICAFSIRSTSCESNGEKTQDCEPDCATEKIESKKARSRIMESRRRGYNHGEREWRRSKRGEDDTQASTIGYHLLHPLEPVRTSNLVDALFRQVFTLPTRAERLPG
jgi:hypothetical protein